MTFIAKGANPSRNGLRIALACIIAVIATTAMLGSAPSSAVAQDASAQFSPDRFASVVLPGDLGQSEIQAWVPATKHSVRGYMLDYWRANGAAAVYGNPISEPFPSNDGYYSQAFENGIFQYFPDLVWTDYPSVSLMPISTQHLTDRIDGLRNDGRRLGGGGDRRAGLWKPVNPAGKTAQTAVAEGGIYNEFTGHTVSGAFYQWYSSHEGYSYLGNPLSQPLLERGLTVQYFDGALLIQGRDGAVYPAPLARETAEALGIDTTPVDQGGLPVYDELLFWTTDNPNPLGDPYSSGRKWIEVSIGQQTLSAYQGDTLITQFLVSTGIAPNNTELGLFHIRMKLPKTDMAGTVDPSGRVVELGQQAADGATGNESPYEVKDVPDVMYFNYDAEALHGAYWHNNFGYRMSHGCVNQPLNFSRFMYGWAPLGTMVWVHE